ASASAWGAVKSMACGPVWPCSLALLPASGYQPRSFSGVRGQMAVPKRKTSPSKHGMRRAHDKVKPASYVEDSDTGKLRRPHHVDLKTGMYRGKQILKVKNED